MTCTPFTEHDLAMQRMGVSSCQPEIDELKAKLAAAIKSPDWEQWYECARQENVERQGEEHRAEAAEAQLSIAVELLNRIGFGDPYWGDRVSDALAKIAAAKTGGAT